MVNKSTEVIFVARKLNLSGGGSNRSLKLVLDQLSEHVDITLITLNSSKNNLKEEEYEVIEYDIGRGRVTEFKEVQRVLSKYNPDIFHIFNPGLLPAAGVHRRNNETPMVGRLNTYNLFCTNLGKMKNECWHECSSVDKMNHDSGKSSEKVIKFPEYVARTHVAPRFANNVDRLFAISPAIQRIYKSNGYENITVVPNFCDPDFLSTKVSQRESDNSATDYLFVGRLVSSKGIDVLIESTQYVKSDISIHIVGEGPEKEALERQSNCIDTDIDIKFHGWVDHGMLHKYYSKCDVMIHPGRWPEPFGRSILEALQFGLPCIVSDTGAPPWIVGDAGLSFTPGSPKDLAAMIQELADSQKLFQNLSDKTSKQVTRFSPKKVVSSILEHYKLTIEN